MEEISLFIRKSHNTVTMNANDRLRINEEKTRNWLNSLNLEDLDSVDDSTVASSVIDSSDSDSESGEEHALGTRIPGQIIGKYINKQYKLIESFLFIT